MSPRRSLACRDRPKMDGGVILALRAWFLCLQEGLLATLIPTGTGRETEEVARAVRLSHRHGATPASYT